MNPIFAPRLRPLLSAVSRGSRRRRSLLSTKAPRPAAPSGQAQPRAGFYDALLEYKLPLQDHTGKQKQVPPPPPPPSPAKAASSEPATTKTETTSGADADEEEPDPDSPAGRARIVFGSSLAGPTRRADIRSQSTLVAGVLVPPKPEEPDHCCMSGCVNCVWDTFREDLEEWVAASAEADERLRGTEDGAEEGRQPEGGGGADDDGGARSQKAGAANLWDEELYKGIPVGIREFMKVEKQLKEMHEKTGTTGG